MNRNRITIKDIARKLNISTSTVSRALTDKWDINPSTRDAVLKLAQELDYHPNPISLSLKGQKSMSIGIVIPEFINSFFPKVILGIQSVLEQEGYQLLICPSNESYEKELSNLRMLEDKFVDGLIVSITKETENVEYFKSLIEKGTPIVFFNRVCTGIEASSITLDDYKWSRMAVDHLIDQGCRRILHLAGPDTLQLSMLRMKGWRDSLAAHDLPADDSLIVYSGLSLEDGGTAAHKILGMEHRPDGIFAINDPVAIGAMKTLQKNGVKIPADIAVVGFSESRMGMIIEPNLSSVEQPTFEMGRVSAQLLLEQIKGREMNRKAETKNIVLDAKLNVRGSSIRG